MVKFSKEYEAQLVPEWKDAFVDYGQLKKDLKKIKIQILSSSSCITGSSSSSSSSNNDHTSYMKQHPSFSTTLVSAVQRLSTNFGHQHREHGPIRVHGRFASSSASNKGCEMYETELFEDIEVAAEFFSRLDLQLNKVNQFYKAKEKEFLERGESLKKQMEILIDLKASMLEPNGEEGVSQSGDSSCSSRRDDDTFFLTYEEEFRTREEETDHQMEGTDQYNEAANKDGMRFTELISRTDDMETSSRRMIKREDSSSSGRVFSCQGKSMRLNIPLTTPSRTFSAMRYLVKEDIVNQSSSKKFDTRKRGTNNRLHVNKSNLHQAEKMIRGAFIELYKGLGYLKTFRNLNMLAFVKILKKFDKVTNKEVMPIYLRVVESSYFNSSDKAVRLSDEVEEIFVKHFAEDNRRKAFKYLKPTHRKESHTVTFLIGLFTGCFLALLVGYIMIAHISGKYKQPSDTVYMETVYPVLSMFSLLFLHFFLYGCNIFMWRKARVNYSFIFELAPTKELKYREVFLICAASITAIVGVLLIHLSLLAKGYSSVHVEAIPGYLVLFFLLLLVCPLNIAYKSSRYCFLRVIRNIVFTPLYKVVMLDFFMADQLCSQVPLLRSLEFIGCYYITGSYRTQDYGYCMRTTYYRDLAYAVSFLPYYWRAMQCARRWFDEGQSSHLINLGKYVSAMLAAGAKVAYEKDKSFGYLCLVIALSSAATVYQLYWDYVKDWGLLQFNSRNPWLRNELMVRHKSIYYFSMVLNLVLRLAWLQTVLHPNIGNIDYRLMGLFLAALEVIRRGQWNFYRLENEHLNNAGKFRAVKNVPLPFHEVEDEN